MTKEEFLNELKKININLTPEQIEKFSLYSSFLIEYNSHTNLTAIKDEEGIYLKHFYDSLTIIKAIDLTEVNNLLDIGTGAGFPGMVLKIIYPHLNITLLDSNNKKINFLKELSGKLNIKNITFYHGRAEDYCNKMREKFDVVTGRAVSNMTTLSELSIPFVRINGYFIAMKGSNEEEIDDASYAIKVLGGKIEDVISFNLPIENSKRQIIKVKKESKTPKEYPRRYEKIVKKPLKCKEK